MFERLGTWSYRYRFLILVAWVVAAGLAAGLAPSLAGAGSSDQSTFLPPDAPSSRARDAVERAFPGSTSASSASITFERAGGLTGDDLAYRDAYAAWAMSAEAPADVRAAATGTETADSRPELEKMLRSDNGEFELLLINLEVADSGDASTVVVDQLREHLTATSPEGLVTHVTGTAAISSDYVEAVKVGTDSTTIVTVVLVLVVLLLIYRAPLAALVPLITIGTAYMVSRGVLAFLAVLGWQVSSLIDTFLVVMVFGVGTDYAIFLISRYREEISGDADTHHASRETVMRIGSVIAASAATVIVGMSSMAFGEFAMISSMGPSVAIAIFVTLIAGLTLTPALLSIFGKYLFWPLHTRPKPEGEPGGFFARLASAVSHHPGAVTIGLIAVLIVPILYLPQVNTNFDTLSELPAGADSRLGYEAIAEHLGEDKVVQSTGLVAADGGTDMLAPASLARLRDLMAEVSATDGVATVTSIVTPEGDGVVPDGLRPSEQLRTIGDEMAEDDGGGATDSDALLGDEVTDGLDQALTYLNGLAAAFPDVAAGPELRAVRGGIADAQDIIDRVRTNAVLATQLRTLSSSITSPTAAAGGDSGDTSDTLMSDYLAELAAAYPEVSSLDAYADGVRAAGRLEDEASLAAALNLADAFERLAVQFEDRPEATLQPESLSDTPAAREIKREAEGVFDALPGQFTALGDVFAARSDDLYIPTGLTGEDAEDLQDLIDAFVSDDRTAARFYVTNADDPYSGGAFAVARRIQGTLEGGATAFGQGAEAHLAGPTSQFADVQDTLETDFGRVGVITVIGIFLVLVVLLRALVAPLYLVATVLLSYGSAVGLSAFLFQEVLGQAGVSFYLPLMVFVLLVALGSDYNIFLMSRVREESEHRPIKDGIRIASGHTGAVITSAGLILAGTFGSMATAPLVVLFQIGVAVAIGVLIDTFLVRSILVPAITTLVGDKAWWPSGAAFAGALGRVPLVPAGAGATVGGVATVSAANRPSRGRQAVAIALVVLVPVTVAGLLTWSLGASTGNLDGVRAAVVNLDEGTTAPGDAGTPEPLEAGADLSVALAEGTGAGFDWVAVDEAEAESGLADGRYAAVLTIPDDFSRTVAGIRADTTGTAPKATLRLVSDDASGYAMSAVARQVTSAITEATGRDVTASYVDGVLLDVSDAQAALASAADDAGSVAGSTTDLADAAAGAGSFAGQLVDGLQEFIDQAGDASDGSQQLIDGTRRLADGSDQLADGARAIARGTRASATGAAQLADGAAQVADGMTELNSQAGALPAQTDALADGAAQVAGGVAGIASGASDLSDGLGALAAGTTGLAAQGDALAAAATDLRGDAVDLSSAADATAADADDLASEAGSLANAADAQADDAATLASQCAGLGGTPELCTAIDGLASGAASVATDADDVASTADDVAASTQSVANDAQSVQAQSTDVRDGAQQLAGALPGIENGIAGSASGAASLAAGAAALVPGADGIADGTRQLADGMPALAGGISQLTTGSSGIADGNAELATGLGQLADGTNSLADGARLSANGADRLADGTASAAGGIGDLTDTMQAAVDAGALVEAQTDLLQEDGLALADEADALAERLRESAAGTASYPDETRQRVGDLASSPVSVDASRINASGGTAGGLAPFLMAIAAWLGALGAFLVLPALWGRDDRRWWMAPLLAFGAAGAVAVAGSVLMALVMPLLLGVEVASVGALVGFAVLSALTFTALVQALVAFGGNRGWLVALLLMVLGIAASGVPLGAAAAPGPLSILHALLPLGHAIDGFRSAITGGGVPLVDAVVLAVWLVGGALVTLAYAAGMGRGARSGDALVPAA